MSTALYSLQAALIENATSVVSSFTNRSEEERRVLIEMLQDLVSDDFEGIVTIATTINRSKRRVTADEVNDKLGESDAARYDLLCGVYNCMTQYGMAEAIWEDNIEARRMHAQKMEDARKLHALKSDQSYAAAMKQASDAATTLKKLQVHYGLRDSQ